MGHNVCARLGGIARPRPVAAIAPQGARSFFSRSYLASEEFKEKYINDKFFFKFYVGVGFPLWHYSVKGEERVASNGRRYEEHDHNVCARLGGIARPRPVAAIAPQGARSFFSRSYLASEEFKEKYINDKFFFKFYVGVGFPLWHYSVKGEERNCCKQWKKI
ncbi:hypothetical protein OROMI_023839 [Orobanche minor]